MPEGAPTLVRTRFNFNGKNNDELNFHKNEVITLTQQLDGGWWEGTLHSTTGWFPSNYVDVIENHSEVTNGHVEEEQGVSGGLADRKGFRATVMRDFMASELLYVNHLNETYNQYLLGVKDGLNDEDWSTLSSNFSAIAKFQSSVFCQLEDTLKQDSREQKIGGILLNNAAELKSLLTEYCYNHPRAIEVVHEKDEYLSERMTSLEKTMPHFVARLSEPFRHLDRYPPFLQELERSMEEDHSDRGNVQRACVIFKELKVSCESTRKQKEAHMELFHAAPIEEWAPFNERGKIFYVGIVPIRTDETEHERCVAIFAKMVLIMEIAASNAYSLVTKIPSQNLVIRRIEGGFHLSSPEVNVTMMTTEYEEWLKAFSQMDGVRVENNVVVSGRPPTPQHSRPLTQMRRDVTPVSNAPPQHSQDTPVSVRPREKKQVVGDLKFNHELGLLLPEGFDDADSPTCGAPISRQKSFTLKPAPLQRCNSMGDAKKAVKMRKEMPIVDPDDTVLLRIVEGYCGLSSGSGGAPVWQQPQLIVADNEKILIEEIVGDEVVIQEKSLVDTVYSLKDQMASLQSEVAQLHKSLDREQRSRRRLEESLKRLSDQPTSPRALSPKD